MLFKQSQFKSAKSPKDAEATWFSYANLNLILTGQVCYILMTVHCLKKYSATKIARNIEWACRELVQETTVVDLILRMMGEGEHPHGQRP